MTELAQRRHGLESFLATCQETDVGTVGVEIGIQPDLNHINLRGNVGDKKFIAAAKSVLGQGLPVDANSISVGEHQIFWLGPNEWLVITPIADSTDLLAQLRESLSGLQNSVTDVSGGQIMMQLSGPGARDVLAKGCTLDFHPGVFKTGSCAQSGLAKANVLIGLTDNQPTFQIVVRRSFEEYLALWLQHASREHRVRFNIV